MKCLLSHTAITYPAKEIFVTIKLKNAFMKILISGCMFLLSVTSSDED